ncbi:YccF domain-containing protein [Ravibacter arvi]|uniref:YccF domain-containing protein n=1 Tax=Ravibacter arvi TaxID=2051041 RepID=A0ABP8LZH1_9BACT
MRLVGNIIWLIMGGFATALEYLTSGLVLCLTIVGIPFGLQCFKLAILMLFPFGRKVVSSSAVTGCLSLPLNIIWIIFSGFWIAITHLFFGVLLAITIIGIPFAKQHFKFMRLAFTPFGKDIL